MALGCVALRALAAPENIFYFSCHRHSRGIFIFRRTCMALDRPPGSRPSPDLVYCLDRLCSVDRRYVTQRQPTMATMNDLDRIIIHFWQRRVADPLQALGLSLLAQFCLWNSVAALAGPGWLLNMAVKKRISLDDLRCGQSADSFNGSLVAGSGARTAAGL